jgi:acetoacetyl-CoA synthetase
MDTGKLSCFTHKSPEEMPENPVLWQPDKDRVQATSMHRFMQVTGHDDYASLYAWSIDDSPAFWEALCEFCDVRFDKAAETTLARPGNIMDAGWFTGSQLNYAAHLLRHEGDEPALVFFGENGARRELSRDQLRREVAAIAAGLREAGVDEGDRVGGYLPNCPEAIIAMLATTSIGAIWSSCSPDFGINGVVDRFGQIEPKVLFAVNGYYYNGKTCDTRATVAGIVDAVGSIRRTVVIPFAGDVPAATALDNAIGWTDFRREGEPLSFTPVAFNHPLYIMYSSGTTGVPKCIVHGHGGTLLQHLKEHVLHTDIGADDRLFYFTTCGWMMWNWLVSGLAAGATLVLFDGSPFFNDGRILWQMAEAENVTVFGTSAKYISALEKAGVRPKDEFSLPKLRAVLSTGSPLSPESFDYVYDAIGDDIQLASISGGTDILSCFVLGNPVLPVRRGELQCRGLGMAVEIWNDDGQPVVGEHGELVCIQAFPSAPVGFWNDPDGSRYKAAYFDISSALPASGRTVTLRK